MNSNQKTKISIFTALVVISVLSRLVPHPWSFTCVGSVILFSMFFFKNTKISILATVSIFLISDFILYELSETPKAGILIYLCWLFYIPSSKLINKKYDFKSIGLAGFTGATLFFIVSNFLVWSGSMMYPHTFSGLITCYIAAIPFYTNHVLGNFVWSFVIFGIYKISLDPQTKYNISFKR
mgnify:FL=1